MSLVTYFRINCILQDYVLELKSHASIVEQSLVKKGITVVVEQIVTAYLSRRSTSRTGGLGYICRLLRLSETPLQSFPLETSTRELGSQ